MADLYVASDSSIGTSGQLPLTSSTIQSEDPYIKEQLQDAYADDNAGTGLRLISQEGVNQLTQDLRKFSDTLTSLKAVFCEERESLDQSLRVVAHERLGELLKVLKNTVNKYEELDSAGILNAAEILINHIKNFNYECIRETVPPEIFSAINNLALAFSSSVSECLIGDINISPRHSLEIPWTGSTKSVEYGQASQKRYSYDAELDSTSTLTAMDEFQGSVPEPVVFGHEKIAKNLEITFDRAKTWSKYANDLLTYVKKKAHIELEYANKLTKLSQTTRAILSEQSFLPFQSLYCTALDNDKDHASNLAAMYQTSLLAHKFVEPLQSTRADHDRQRKILLDTWRKTKKKLEDAETNLRKAKQQYQSRNQEYMKAKEAALKADQQFSEKEVGHSRQSSGNSNHLTIPSTSSLGIIGSSKIEKKKKHEDDSYAKAMQAEQYFRVCKDEADARRRELEKKQEDILVILRDSLTKCDQTTKCVTMNFFSALCELTSPAHVQYQALLDESKTYEPGSQYEEYLRHITPHHSDIPDSLSERYSVEGESYRAGGSDTESSSNRSVDDLSPAASPANNVCRKSLSIRRASIEGSLSFDEILDDGKEGCETSRNKPGSQKESTPVPADSSPAPLRPPSAVPKMMKMVANVKEAFKLQKKPKMTVFGVDFSFAAQDAADGIPMLIKRCVAEIDNRGLGVKGIYRVNGVKNRIEKICTMLDSPQCARVDLSEQLPHDISGVLKYFLRQLPEPLVPYEFYDKFLEIGKEYTELGKSRKSENDTALELKSNNDDSVSSTDLIEENDEVDIPAVLNKMKWITAMLPSPHQKTLYYIMAHLSRVAQHQAENKMTASNLAIIFGPTLLRLRHSNESGQELSSLMDLPNQSQVIELLITHHREVFSTSPQRDQVVGIPSRSESLKSPEIIETGDFFKSSAPGTEKNLQKSTVAGDQSYVQEDSGLTTVTNNSDSASATSNRNEYHHDSSPRMELTSDASFVTNDRRTILPHCSSLMKNSSACEITGGFGVLEVRSSGCHIQNIHEGSNETNSMSRIVFESTISDMKSCYPSAISLPLINPSNKSQEDGSASLCKSSEVSTKQPVSQTPSGEASLNIATLSHRPRSHVINNYPVLRPGRLSIDSNRHQTTHGGTYPLAAFHESFDIKSSRLPPDPVTISCSGDASSSSICNAVSPPSPKSKNRAGRTPPFDKSQSWSIMKDHGEKMLLDMGDSTDDSFC